MSVKHLLFNGHNHGRNNAVIILLLVSALLVTISNCSKKSVPGKKQVILISIDTLRADHMSAYGYSRDTTPHLSRLLKDSVYYTQAYPNGCWTMPSHMSLLTGVLPSRHGINQSWGEVRNKKYRQMNESIKTIAQVLETHDANISTMKMAKLPDVLGFANGFDKKIYRDPFYSKKKIAPLLEELELNKDRDFFFFIHTWRVHAPYNGDYFLEKGRLSEEDLTFIRQPGKAPGKRNKRAASYRGFLNKVGLFNAGDCMTLYDGGIREVDQNIGILIDKCRQLGIYDNVMLVVVSDHGEHFAEHFPKLFYNYHGKDFFEEFIRVPLIIKFPAATMKPGPVDFPVSLVDVVPTILEFYKIPVPGFVQGESLCLPREKRKKYLVSEATSVRVMEKKMIRVGDLKYIVAMKAPLKNDRTNWDAVTERWLFDLKNDPGEKVNLYNQLKHKGACVNFEKMLREIIKTSAMTNLTTKETTVDQETLNQMKAL
ncbi:MAG: choline-sulfatase, partial [Acidobacteriota bacterium]|nr:choline-sulfatase [Acidobacteriota bacterium]